MTGKMKSPFSADRGGIASILRDLSAGVTNAIANVPDAMANAVLTGVSPVRGLYALMLGTPTAALTTSSEYVTVVVTAAMSIAVGDAIAPVPQADRTAVLALLVLMIGAITVVLGILKAGKMMRFVPNAVMRGFLTGVAVNIVIGQFSYLTGATSDAPGKMGQVVDILLHPRGMSIGSIALAALTISVVLAIERTPARKFAMAFALVAVTALAQALQIDTIRVGDVGAIPSRLPALVLPQFSYLFSMIIPAISVALIGLIQTAGISANTPNRSGRYPDASRDFVGQGLGSVVSGVFGGVAVGGSVSSTAINIQAGARSRLANFIIGPTIMLLVLLLAPQVESIPMAALAALLVIVGTRAVDVDAIIAVWDSNRQSAVVMAITFVGTLLMPVQYAVLLGIALAILAQVYSQGTGARMVGIVLLESGELAEVPAPKKLEANAVLALEAHGSFSFAGAQAFYDSLPDPEGAVGATVILRVRGREGTGSTFIEVLRRYHKRLAEEGAVLMLAGVGPDLNDQLERTGVVDLIGRENVYYATQIITHATVQAILQARRRTPAR